MDNNQYNTTTDKEWDKIIGNILKRFKSLVNASRDPLISFEDLKQEAWIGLWTASQSYDPNKGTKFTTFAYKHIVFHLCKYITKALRKKDCKLSIDPLLILVDKGFLENEAERSDLIDTIFDYVKDEDHFDILEMYFLKGMTFREIAAAQNVSHQAVEVRLRKIIKKLGKRMCIENSQDSKHYSL